MLPTSPISLAARCRVVLWLLASALPVSALATATASAAWPQGGFAIVPSDSTQVTPAIATDGAGGAYVLWSDYRSYSDFQPPVYAQHVTDAGQVATGWPAGGMQLPWRSSEAGQIALA